MSLSFDSFWLSVMAYEPALCVGCDTGVAENEQGYCGRCHWRLKAEVEEGLRAFGSYLGNWAAFRDWEMP